MQPWPALAPHARSVTLQANGLRLHIYDAGSRTAPALLLVHGLGDEADTWRHIISPLAEQWRVIAPDLPGFGRSDKPKRAYTMPFLCETLLALLDALQLSQATLIGHSLGGIIAHTLALTHHERVHKLVLVDGGLSPRPQKLDLGTLFWMLPPFGEWSYNRLRRDPQAAYNTLRPYYADMDQLPEQDRQFLFQRVNERVWSDGQRDAYLSVLRQLPIWMMRHARAGTTAVNMPTLVLWGERDRLMPVDHAHALTQVQSSATLVTIPAAGHMPHQEQPDLFLQALKRFLIPGGSID